MDLVDGEAAERDAEEAIGPAQLAQRGRERMGAIHLHVPISADDEEAGALEIAGQVDQQIQVPRSAQWRSSSTIKRGWTEEALRRKPVTAWRRRQRSSSGSPSAWGSTSTLSRISETMRATSAAPVPSSDFSFSGSRARTYVRKASTKAR